MNKKKNYSSKIKILAAVVIGLLGFGNWWTTASAQVNVTATAGTTGPTSYPFLSTALAAVNAGTHQGDIVIEISASIADTGVSRLASTGAGLASYTSVVIRPSADGVTLSYASAQGFSVIELNGADSVTIDGDNPYTPGTNRDLTVTNTAAATVSFASVIRVATSGTAPFTSANGIYIQNVNINGNATGRNSAGTVSTTGSENTTFGVIAGPNGGTTTAITSVTGLINAAARVNNFNVTNCAINQCARGVVFLGAAVASSTSVNITNNLIGDQAAVLTGAYPYTSPATTVYVKGISVQGTNAVNISGNTIKNIVSFVNTTNTAIELLATIGTGGVTISNNTIRGVVLNVASTGSGTKGIAVSNSGSAYTISNNDISAVESAFNGGNAAAAVNRPAGLFIATAAPSGTVSNNRVYEIVNRQVGTYGVLGVWMNGGSNITINNNRIWAINQDVSGGGVFNSLQYGLYGMTISAGTGHKVYHNTIHLSGALIGVPAAENQTFGFVIASTACTGMDVRNNIFSNTMTGGTTGNSHTSIFLPSGGTTTMNLTLNNNIYYCGTNTAMNGIAQVGITVNTGLFLPGNFNATTTTPATNFRSYVNGLKTGGGNDNASFVSTAAAPFVSATDLHITPGIKSPIESTGATLAGFNTDIDGDARPGPAGSIHGGGSAPDLGADEADLIFDGYAIDSSMVDQLTTTAAPGETQGILRIRVYYSGSVAPGGAIAPWVLESLKLTTTGSSSTADIDNAKVYYTGSNPAFSAAVQYGSTVASPNGTFYVTGSQTLSKGVNYLWLTYSINTSAGIGNVVDAILDSLQISGVNYSPFDGNPAGNVQINTPMTYIGSVATQANQSNVAQGSVNAEVMGLQVITSSTGSPVGVTSLTIATTGTTALGNITNLRIWYTGNSKTFATTSQFGSTVAVPAASQTITGIQALNNDTNYFWVTYDVTGAALAGNRVDAECTSLIVGGITQTPVITAPTGNRMIRVNYCTPVYSDAPNACINSAFISSVSTTGGVTNISNTGNGCSGGSQYIYYPNQVLTIAQNGTFTINASDATGATSIAAWIDYDQDGTFTTPELIFVGTGTTASTITIPCSARIGSSRLRIRSSVAFIANNPCADLTIGEAEDYNVEILPGALAYASSTVIQQTGFAAPGATNRAILRIPVKTSGCTIGTATEFNFSTTGTSSNGDIVTAKLYQTGTSPLFNTSKLVGTVASPSGAFTFTVNDTLVSNDTTNYWLAYDVSIMASTGNILDGVLNDLTVLGATHIPTVTNPAGSVTIDNPMAFNSAEAFQASVSKVGKGTANNAIVGVKVVMSSTGAPQNLTQINFNTNGTTDTANVRNLKVWYTGNSNIFTTGLQFGSTLAFLPGTTTFNITGSQALANDTNYFWLSYDINAGALTNNLVDAEATEITIGGVPLIPSVTAPAGTRQIRDEYCTPVHSGYGPCISNVTLNTLNNSLGGACALPSYTNFSTALATTTLAKNTPYTLSVTTDGAAIVSVWFDLNANGAFEASEWQQVVVQSATGVASTIPIMIPCTAVSGEMRMRIRARGATNPNGAADFCGSFGTGESEDYTITVVDNPIDYNFSTAVQQTGVAAQNEQNRAIMRIPVVAKGCGVGTVTRFDLSTLGTTSNPDIITAKIYKTGNSPVFNTSKLVGSAASPSGVFSIVTTDTLLNDDTTNYWLTYDVSASASIGNILDATFDGIEATGSVHVPAVSDPAGNVVIDMPMTYISSTVTQTGGSVGQGAANANVAGLRVITSSTGSATSLTSIDLSTNGTTSLTDITNLKVWYTGSSKTFATTTQFGSTVAAPAASQTITGLQNLVNDTNYFWITYDIAAGAVVGNVVDAEIASITVGGVTQIPAVTAPPVNKKIRAEYCTPLHSFAGPCISNVTFNTLNNTSLAVCALPSYTNISTATATTTVERGTTYNLSVTVDDDAIISVWVDVNANGIFEASEWQQVATTTTAGVASTIPVFIPCEASVGETRIRVRARATLSPNGPAEFCINFGSGESEDYTITIVDKPAAYDFSTAIQQTGTVAQGATDRAILRIPVTAKGCGAAIATQFNFNTAGTTNMSNIVTAKLYQTGNSTFFTTAKLVGSVASPSGPFTITTTDTLLNNDTTNYWLAYDVSASASIGNSLDATFDGIEVAGVIHVPAVSNPAGDVVVDMPMTYTNSTVTQVTGSVGKPATNAAVVEVMIVTSSTGSPLQLTSMDVATTGTTSLADVTNLRVWYTGNSSTFATTTQFGAAVPAPAATHTITGVQALNNDTNYFWVTYDVVTGATVGNMIDAEVTSFILGGSSRIPSVTNPSGNRKIRNEYCQPSYTDGTADGDFVGYVELGSIINTTGGASAPFYTYFGSMNTNLTAGATYTITVGAGTFNDNDVAAWIDFNGDGLFTSDEKLGEITGLGAAPLTTSFTFSVPLNAVQGVTRLRVREAFSFANMDACLAADFGETEDYNVTIMPAPAAVVYTWNRTVPASYLTAGNWTPARTQFNLQDKLIFNGGGAVTLTDVPTDNVSSITITNGTNVSFAADAAATGFSVADSLNLVSGKLTLSTIQPLTVGSGVANTGVITGTGSVEGILSRWVSASVASYAFPLSAGSNSRNVLVSYTVAPTTGGVLTTRFVNTSPGNNGLPLTEGGISVNKAAPAGVWRLAAGNGLAGGTFSGAFTGENFTGVSDFNGLVLLKRINAASAWTLDGTHTAATGSNAMPVAGRTGMIGLGEFGFGADSLVNPLPVKLLMFAASNNKGSVVLNWATGTEVNNKGFEIERSVNGRLFEYVGFVKGAGNSQVKLNYSLTDKKAFAITNSKTLYYRLKQVDANGAYEYSQVVSVTSEQDLANAVSAYPNPFNGAFTVSVQTMKATSGAIRVFDMQGKMVASHDITLEQGVTLTEISSLQELPVGVYVVKVLYDDEVHTLKMIKTIE